jgi:hypothetical protein
MTETMDEEDRRIKAESQVSRLTEERDRAMGWLDTFMNAIETEDRVTLFGIASRVLREMEEAK